jgi:GPH family glycoside/pentoside/hexuronide:cation symporter
MSDGVSGAARIPLSVRIGFSVGDFGFLLVWQGTALFLMYFYTDILGISPVVAGAIYLAAMVWDAVTDPVFATLADRTRTRWGRYRPWLLFGALPFALSYPLAFSTPGDLPVAPWLWALVTHIALRTAYTLVSMPFNSLQARLTNDAQARSVLAGFRMIGAASGGLAIVFLTPVLVAGFGPEREAEAYFTVACIAAVLACAGLLYCFMTMREPEDMPDDPNARPSFWSDLVEVLPTLLRNGPLIRVFLTITIGSVCLGMFGKCVLYYFKYDLERPDLTVWALVLPALMLIITTPVWVRIAARRSKRDALMIGLSISLIGYLMFFFNSSDALIVSALAILLIGIGGASLPVMFWAMLPDTVEYGEAMTGVRAEARTFGYATFAQKAAVGINAALLGALLDASGFEANAVQTEATLTAIKAIMALVPAAGAAAIVWIMIGYRLDRQAHARLLGIISAAKARTHSAP